MRASLPCTFIGAALIAAAATSTAVALENTSQYTSVATKNCEKIATVTLGKDEFSNTYACPGVRHLLRGYWAVVDETDLRTTVTITFDQLKAHEQPAYRQGFAPFNSVHDTLEWRIDATTKKPIATIQRWFIADNADLDKNDRPKTVGLLVVTRTPPGASCHVAYIDVRANENPNALAQKAADELAAKFDCKNDRIHLIGNKGRAAELAGIK